MTETEKFRTVRLVARPWQIEDLPLAMELWGDPAVTALIRLHRDLLLVALIATIAGAGLAILGVELLGGRL